MQRFAQLVFAAGLGIVLAASTAAGQERRCVTTADCTSTTVCIQSFRRIGTSVVRSAPTCKVRICNDDGDCAGFRFRSVCLEGRCQATGGDPFSNPPVSRPGGRVGEGAACGRIKIGHVTKNVGCPRPFVCDKGNREQGVCQRPQI